MLMSAWIYNAIHKFCHAPRLGKLKIRIEATRSKKNNGVILGYLRIEMITVGRMIHFTQNYAI